MSELTLDGSSFINADFNDPEFLDDTGGFGDISIIDETGYEQYNVQDYSSVDGDFTGGDFNGYEFEPESNDMLAQSTTLDESADDPSIRFGTGLVTGGKSTPIGTVFTITPNGEDGLDVENTKIFVSPPGIGVGTFQPSTGNVSIGVGSGASIPGTNFTTFGNVRLEVDNPFDGEPWEAPDLSFNGGYFAPGMGGTNFGAAGSITVDTEDGMEELTNPLLINPLGIP